MDRKYTNISNRLVEIFRDTDLINLEEVLFHLDDARAFSDDLRGTVFNDLSEELENYANGLTYLGKAGIIYDARMRGTSTKREKTEDIDLLEHMRGYEFTSEEYLSQEEQNKLEGLMEHIKGGITEISFRRRKLHTDTLGQMFKSFIGIMNLQGTAIANKVYANRKNGTIVNSDSDYSPESKYYKLEGEFQDYMSKHSSSKPVDHFVVEYKLLTN